MRYHNDKPEIDTFEKYRGEGRMSERNRTYRLMDMVRSACEAREKGGMVTWRDAFNTLRKELQKSPKNMFTGE